MDTQRFQHAIALRDSGRVEEALLQLRALAEATSNLDERASLVLNQSTCLALLGRFEEARQRTREASRISTRNEIRARADWTEAILSWHESRHKEALEKLERLLEVHSAVLQTPDHRDLYEQTQINRGIILSELARYHDAQPVLEEGLSFDLPTQTRGDLLYNLGLCHFKLGDLEEAKKALSAAIETGAQDAYIVSAHYFLGIIHTEQKLFEKALEEFQWCEYHPDPVRIPTENIYGWLARVSHELGRTTDAQHYQTLARSRPA